MIVWQPTTTILSLQLILLLLSRHVTSISLSQFQQIQGFSDSCENVWQEDIPGCTKKDFATSNSCSRNCLAGVNIINAEVLVACAEARVSSNTLLGEFLAGFGVSALCGSSDKTTATIADSKTATATAAKTTATSTSLTSVHSTTTTAVQETTTPPSVRSRNLADLIAFNKAHSMQEMPLFGQEEFEKAQATKGLDDPAYKKARRLSFEAAGRNGIDKLLKDYDVVALVGPTEAPAWKIDAVNGDQSAGGGAGSLAAVAGYPHLTVPMGLVKGLPVGLSFIGPKWSEKLLLNLGYAYEQARGPFPAPQFLPSIESSPEVAPALEPQRLP